MKFDQITHDYSVKHDKWIKNVTRHLDILGIDVFSHFTVGNDGSYFIISNYPEQLEYFYAQKHHLVCPFFTNPHFFKTGSITRNSIQDLGYQDCLDIVQNKFEVNDPLIMIEKSPTGLEGYFFAYKSSERRVNYFDYLDSLKRFSSYYQKEKQEKFGYIETEYNIKNELGEVFYQKPKGLGLVTHQQANDFLKNL